MLNMFLKIVVFSMPALMFVLGMLVMYVAKVKKSINYKRLMDMYLTSRVGKESCENIFGINTITLYRDLDRDFSGTPYHIYFVDRFGEAHEVTHAQMEPKGLGNSLTLYSIKPHEYDSKGRYKM